MYLPTNQGFDHYLGIPYSHDQGVVTVPLFANDTIKQQPVSFPDLEKSYSNFATQFIIMSARRKQPFFLYYPSHHTHYPQFAGKGTTGKSRRGPFGDALMEFDSTVGNIIQALVDSGVHNNTFVFFTADNGPELLRMSRGGNAGLLKCGKDTTYEGGVREPAIAYWPRRIQAGSVKSSTTPDQDCHETAHLKYHDPPLLFDLETDPSENYNLATHPEYKAVLQLIQDVKTEFEGGMVFGEAQVGKGTDPALEPCCAPQCTPKPTCCSCS
ncbi:hypothetical protein MATL_G00248920 [Megalops atlanticus]|uniref:Sulfatase N-terminal domain-containing protein n=1 Tax=Megalops atlanticus TaxID=7932 RepID=A0A9D3SWX4_MEGAT|nr:hypothetical protein MATL_G00248920 [Megalops atlanticus]